MLHLLASSLTPADTLVVLRVLVYIADCMATQYDVGVPGGSNLFRLGAPGGKRRVRKDVTDKGVSTDVGTFGCKIPGVGSKRRSEKSR